MLMPCRSSRRTSRNGTPVPQQQPSQPLKRQRSVTPSIITESDPNLDPNDPLTRSPLAKRKRLSEMRGSSRLGNQLDITPAPSPTENGKEQNNDEGEAESDDESSSSSDDSDIADFLAEDLFNGEEGGG
ncbi:hypothetical protein FRC07_005322 [Ceratobasidium sp. 392]|nr:hypothetical protein FRC07_005322 [Ceratobasidium sp. 392]